MQQCIVSEFNQGSPVTARHHPCSTHLMQGLQAGLRATTLIAHSRQPRLHIRCQRDVERDRPHHGLQLLPSCRQRISSGSR